VPVIQTPDRQVSGRQFRPGPGESHHNLDKNTQINFVEILGPNRRPEERSFSGGRPNEGFFPGNRSLRLIHLFQLFK
jgi:hypothetical protein